MLILKKLRFKNFLSFGNTFTEVDFQRSPTTMMVGTSGHGKSTFIDALTFVMFGKPFRQINKGLLINTVNKKDCLVELDLEVEGDQYLIRRGIKPDVFEIYKNTVLVNQDASVRDYQKWVEDNVFKMSLKVATQQMILGYANYKPFMELDAASRRAMVDQILDIDVFTKMSKTVSDHLRNLKTSLVVKDKEIEILRAQVAQTKNLVSQVRSQDESSINQLNSELCELTLKIDSLMLKRDGLVVQTVSLVEETRDISNLNSSISEIRGVMSKLRLMIEQKNEVLSFMKTHDNCPVCKQDIDALHKSTINAEATSFIGDLINEAKPYQNDIKDKLALVEEKTRSQTKLTALDREISSINEQITLLNQQRTRLYKKIEDSSKNDEGMVKGLAQQVLDQIESLQLHDKQKQEMIDERHCYEVCQALLKDNGIKSRIIAEYIPALNQIINEYLDRMGFHMRFQLNSEFEETILSRFRDGLSYYSLSEGEKSRLSLAITLAWRKIAEMKNSTRCNVLILDEVLDDNLAASDIDAVWGIAEEITQSSNLFIISHRPDALYDRVRSVINVKKEGNFSEFVK